MHKGNVFKLDEILFRFLKSIVSLKEFRTTHFCKTTFMITSKKFVIVFAKCKFPKLHYQMLQIIYF